MEPDILTLSMHVDYGLTHQGVPRMGWGPQLSYSQLIGEKGGGTRASVSQGKKKKKRKKRKASCKHLLFSIVVLTGGGQKEILPIRSPKSSPGRRGKKKRGGKKNECCPTLNLHLHTSCLKSAPGTSTSKYSKSRS